MLHALKGDIQTAISDIRRLVYDLRPPTLDNLGLAASLCLLAERCQSADLSVACDLPAAPARAARGGRGRHLPHHRRGADQRRAPRRGARVPGPLDGEQKGRTGDQRRRPGDAA